MYVPKRAPRNTGGFTLFEGWAFALGFPENKRMIGAETCLMDFHHPTVMERLTYVAPEMVRLVFMVLTSSIREPALQRFMVL
jgi:hypothetical protein